MALRITLFSTLNKSVIQVFLWLQSQNLICILRVNKVALCTLQVNKIITIDVHDNSVTIHWIKMLLNVWHSLFLAPKQSLVSKLVFCLPK